MTEQQAASPVFLDALAPFRRKDLKMARHLLSSTGLSAAEQLNLQQLLHAGAFRARPVDRRDDPGAATLGGSVQTQLYPCVMGDQKPCASFARSLVGLPAEDDPSTSQVFAAFLPYEQVRQLAYDLGFGHRRITEPSDTDHNEDDKDAPDGRGGKRLRAGGHAASAESGVPSPSPEELPEELPAQAMDDSQSFTAFTVSTVGHDIGNLVSEAASEVACGMSVLAQGTGASRGEDFGAASVRILGTGEVVNCRVPAQTTDDRFDGTTGGTHGGLVAALLPHDRDTAARPAREIEPPADSSLLDKPFSVV